MNELSTSFLEPALKRLGLHVLGTLALCFVFLGAFSSVVHAQKSAKSKTPPPSTEPHRADPNSVDYEMITRIRNEAFRDSKVMEILSQLADVIGPRLTNSPNQLKASEWTKEQLTAWGLENAHCEPWGPFGRGWSYEAATIRMTSPDQAEFLALPKAWTLSTNGTVTGTPIRVKIASKEDFEKYRGKLAGAIVLNGELRPLRPNIEPKSERYSEKGLEEVFRYEIPLSDANGPYPAAALQERLKRAAFAKELNRFFAEEKVALVIEPSRAPGEGGTIFVQGNGSAYKKDEPVGVPTVVMANEHYGRIYRMLELKANVQLEANVKTSFTEADPFGYNVIAEIPGSDLKDEVVMIGAHLDSWHGGTGATDNGAGSAVMMEVVRILKTLGVKPRRTIRIALWTGEEEGLLGSQGYVREHLAKKVLSNDPAEANIPEYLRKSAGPLELKPEYNKVSIYFNLDSGTGKIRGVYLQENQALAPIFQQWMEPFRDLGMTTLTMRNTGGSDFLSFDAVGVPGIDFLQDEIEYETRTHHSNMDVFERVQREDMMQASAIISSFVYHAAMRDEKMPRKALPKEMLTANSQAK